jgi:hypothetical protein
MEFIKEGEGTEIPQVGVDLKPASGSIASFECGGKSVTIGGSVIVPVTTVDHMVSAFKLKALGTGGVQAPEAFEVGPKDTPTFNEGSEEAGGVTASVTTADEEALEIKAIP